MSLNKVEGTCKIHLHTAYMGSHWHQRDMICYAFLFYFLLLRVGCIHVHVCECKHTHAMAHMRKSEGNLGCQSLLSTSFETGSRFCCSPLHTSGWMVHELLRILLARLPSPHITLRLRMHAPLPGFTCVLGKQT